MINNKLNLNNIFTYLFIIIESDFINLYYYTFKYFKIKYIEIRLNENSNILIH